MRMIIEDIQWTEEGLDSILTFDVLVAPADRAVIQDRVARALGTYTIIRDSATRITITHRWSNLATTETALLDRLFAAGFDLPGRPPHAHMKPGADR